MVDTLTRGKLIQYTAFLLLEDSVRRANRLWARRKTRLHAFEQSRLADRGWVSGSTAQSRHPHSWQKDTKSQSAMVLTSALPQGAVDPRGQRSPGQLFHHSRWFQHRTPSSVMGHFPTCIYTVFWNFGKKFTPPLQILSSPQTLPQTPSGKISAHLEPFSAFYGLKAFCTATHDLRHWSEVASVLHFALADVHAPAFREDCNGRFAWLLSPPYTLHMAAVRAMGPFLPQVTSCSILLHMVVLDSTEWWQQEQFPDAG